MQNLDSKNLQSIVMGFVREKSPLPALRILYQHFDRTFQIPLPGFRATVTGGPANNRQLLITEREKLRWRSPDDPVTKLLRKGVLVVDGLEHDQYRKLMEPLLAPGALPNYTARMASLVDRVTASWKTGQVVDMLVECRKITLLIIMDALFGVDFWDDLPRLWQPILKAIQYISPGAWVLFPKLPRLGYRKDQKILDEYLYGIIQSRRSAPPRQDLLGHLITSGLDDDSIRDQMLTMLIAGHDTTTALLAWTFYLLGKNTQIYANLQTELDRTFETSFPSAPAGWQPELFDAVIKEALRLYPPIHLGNRRPVEDIILGGHKIPAGQRIMYSTYLTHRDPALWENPDQFDPSHFSRGKTHQPFSYLPFGAGPRACIGAAFGMAESRIILSRLLNTFNFELISSNVYAHMGATLEPKPGVRMKVSRFAERELSK